MEEKKIENVRTPELIGAEIRMYVMTGRQITLLCGIEIGRRLTEVKEMLPHGEWLPWLERETDFSERTAQRYMRVFTEYGANQMWLLEPETNATTLSDLPISKALALLSVPESEREAFAESVGAAEISTRELGQAIAEKQAAEARAAQAEQDRKASESLLTAANKKAEEAAAALQEARNRVKELESRPIEVAVERDEKAIEEAAAAARAEAQKKVQELEKQLESAKKKAEKVEKERDALKDAATKAGEKAEESARAEVQAAQQKLATAEAEAATAKEELEKMRKQLAASDKDVTEFGVHFKALQAEVREIAACMDKVHERDSELAEKMRSALRKVLAPWIGGAET